MSRRDFHLSVALTGVAWVLLSGVAIIFDPEAGLWVAALACLPLVTALGVGPADCGGSNCSGG